MAEISECSNSLETSERKAEQEGCFDPITMRRTKPGMKRLVLTLSVLFSFLFGSHFLWKSIEVYRAPLPFEDIASLSERMHSNPLQFPCKCRAIFIGFDSKTPEELSHVEDSVFNGITRLTSKAPQCGSCSSNFSVLVAFDTDSGGFQSRINPTSDQCGEIRSVDFDADDDTVDDILEFALGKSYQTGGKWYTVVVVNGHAGFKAVIGKYRHAWIVGKPFRGASCSENIRNMCYDVHECWH